jgi:pimeloyl-ACP methyl ester carboxylesterase
MRFLALVTYFVFFMQSIVFARLTTPMSDKIPDPIPALRSQPLKLVSAPLNALDAATTCQDISLSDSEFKPGVFKIVKIYEGTNKEWWGKDETGSLINHYNEYWHVGRIDYQITCGNGGVYEGSIYSASDSWYCDKEDEWIGDDCGDVREIALKDMDYLIENSSRWEIGKKFKIPITGEELIVSYNYPLRFTKKDLISHIKDHYIEVLPISFEGERGILARPVLLIHGINSSFEVWGVKSKDGLKKGDAGHSEAQVKSYNVHSLPDILVRQFNLNNTPTTINSNGIYFYQAGSQKYGDNYVDDPLGWADVRSQSRDLYTRIEEVLDHHYGQFGINWRAHKELGIDLVAHSQGGLVIREMLRGLKSDNLGNKNSPDNPANHINRILTINTPHFGSTLSGTVMEATKYPGLDLLVADINLIEAGTPSNRLLMSGKIELGPFADLGNTVCTFGTDCYYVDVDIRGPYFGPYKINFDPTDPVRARVPKGPITFDGFGDIFADMRKTGKHLSPSHPLILGLKSAEDGFPRKPDGSLIPTLPMYSENNDELLSVFMGEFGENNKRFCAAAQEWSPLGLGSVELPRAPDCFAYNDIMNKVFKNHKKNKDGYGLKNLIVDDTFENMLHDLQEGWMHLSDAVVEAESQKFIDEDVGLFPWSPSLAGYLLPPKTYDIHYSEAPWESVAHLPLKISTNMPGLPVLDFFHRGATGQGKDMYCGLYPECSGDSESNKREVIRMAETSDFQIKYTHLREPVYAKIQYVSLRGDWSVQTIDATNGENDLGVVNAETNELEFLVKSTDEGVRIYRHIAGKPGWYSELGPDEINTKISIERIGNIFKVKAMGSSGKIWESRDYELNLGADIKLVLFQEHNDDQSVLIGHATVSDPSTQLPPELPAHLNPNPSLEVLHVDEAFQNPKESRPRFWMRNISDQDIHGYYVRYYFRSDNGTYSVRLLQPESEVYKVVQINHSWSYIEIDGHNWVIPPNRIEPTLSGWEFVLSHNDGSDWNHWNDYSADYNAGYLRENQKIVVYDPQGKIIWGKEPQTQDIVAAETMTDFVLLPSSDLQLDSSKFEVKVIDQNPQELNMLRPVLSVQNNSQEVLRNFYVELFIQIPPGKSVAAIQDWYTPDSDVSLVHFENDVWKIKIDFNQNDLPPGGVVHAGQFGVHLSDWSNWDKTIQSYSIKKASGEILFSSLPLPANIPTIPRTETGNVRVELMEDSYAGTNQIKPRLRFVNDGETMITKMDFSLNFNTENQKYPVFSPWYLAGCTAAQTENSTGLWTLNFSCANLNWQPGAFFPDNSGIHFGLNYPDWSVWDATNDPFLSGITSQWTATSNITILSIEGP